MYSLNIYIDNILWRTDYRRTWDEADDLMREYIELNSKNSKMIYDIRECPAVLLDDAK